MTEGLPFKILVVEDDVDDRFFMDDAFVELGYAQEVKKFVDGDRLLHYLGMIDEELYPNLIVLDNTLPKWDAGQLLETLKKDPRYESIPVIVYSTSTSPAIKKRLMQQGAYGCFEKPAARLEILEMVKLFRSIAEGKNPVNKV